MGALGQALLMHTTARVAAFLLLTACASVHEPIDPMEPVDPVDPESPYDPEPIGPIHGTVPAPRTALEACLIGGGSLVEVATVNNDDVTEHGDLTALAVDADGRLAVAGADGTIKLWTIEDGFLGQINTGMIAYGAELAGTPSTELSFFEGRIVAGDVRGLVTSWTVEGDMQVLGGVEPDFSIRAVAIDRQRGFVAHADERETGHVFVRALDGSSVVGPLDSELHVVNDLAFMNDGALVVAGRAWGDRAALEIRDGASPRVVLGSYDTRITGDVAEVAPCGDRIAFAGPTSLGVIDRELNTIWSRGEIDHAPVGVAMTAAGQFVLTAGADGSLRVHTADEGLEVDAVDVADPVILRAEPTGRAVFVGSRDGLVHVFECQAL
jgi:WD40 repeat protein